MTSLLTPTSAAETQLRHRRPLVLLATAGGAVAAASTLVVCLALGVIGWFLADAGIHGAPRDGLRIGALGWLMGHGAGLQVAGVAITIVPLGLTALCGWVVWRVGLRVGDSVSGHGPDADRLADGERDWTVPVAAALFLVGYVTVVLVAHSLAATPESASSGPKAVLWATGLTLLFGAPAIAVGSGRAAIWAALLPPSVRAGWAAAVRILGWFLVVSSVVLLTALCLDLAAAANVLSQLHTDAGESATFLALSGSLLPNAVVYAGSYLLGPGFAVGAGTLVSPTVVVLGPLPLFPLLAALPDAGPTPAWTGWLLGLPPLIAAFGAARAQRRHPTTRWSEALLRAGAGGMAAGVAFALLTALAGGSAGPGRMREVGPPVAEVLVHAVPAFALGALLGALVTTWWQRRHAEPSG